MDGTSEETMSERFDRLAAEAVHREHMQYQYLEEWRKKMRGEDTHGEWRRMNE